jgi:hypothetical protein
MNPMKEAHVTKSREIGLRNKRKSLCDHWSATVLLSFHSLQDKKSNSTRTGDFGLLPLLATAFDSNPWLETIPGDSRQKTLRLRSKQFVRSNRERLEMREQLRVKTLLFLFFAFCVRDSFLSRLLLACSNEETFSSFILFNHAWQLWGAYVLYFFFLLTPFGSSFYASEWSLFSHEHDLTSPHNQTMTIMKEELYWKVSFLRLSYSFRWMQVCNVICVSYKSDELFLRAKDLKNTFSL